MSDLKFAFRQLLKNPGFTAVAVLTLALGIGATTAIFSVVNGVVLKPLPFEQPQQLVQVFEAPRPGGQNSVSPGVFMDWREQATSFEGFTAYSSIAMNFAGDGEPERVGGLRMTASGLRLFRSRPLVGRIFAPDEDQAGKEKVVVLTHQLWKRRFAGDREIVGRQMLLNDESYTVVGVLPAGFFPFEMQEFVVPWVLDPKSRNSRAGHFLRVLARLNPGVTLDQARAELEAISQRTKPLYPAWKRDWGTTILPMQEQLVQGIKPALLVLLGAVGFVLLIACANVAGLLIAKMSARQKEIAVRAALGATRLRIVRQLLTESVLLSGVGAGLGLLFAFWSVNGLRQLVGGMNIARAHEITLDPAMLGLALIVALLAGIGFGLAPALQASRPNLNDALKDGTRGSAMGGTRLRGLLVIGEVALALVLLAGAGLMLHSFFRLVSVPTGFNPARALTVQLTLSPQKYPDHSRRVAFYNLVAERVAGLPGVHSAGCCGTLPLRGGTPDNFFRIPGRVNHREPGYDADFDVCTADYFRAMGIPLLRGRFFEAREVGAAARVAIINKTLADEFFPGEEPLGRHIGEGDLTWEIVGIVGDVRMRNLARRAGPMLYRPQTPGDSWRNATLVVRTATDSPDLAASVREVIRQIDPTQPVATMSTLEEIVAASVAERRLTLVLLGLFAGAALLLAGIGLYGVIAYAVAQRTREFGIHVALGASRRNVLALILRQGLRLVVVGLVLGLAAALSLTHLLAKMLYEIKPTDPLTFGAVSILLLMVGLLACLIPAQRATKVEPLEALRYE